jgi:hypothetical protein
MVDLSTENFNKYIERQKKERYYKIRNHFTLIKVTKRTKQMMKNTTKPITYFDFKSNQNIFNSEDEEERYVI